MLLNLHKKTWTSGLHLEDFEKFSEKNQVVTEGFILGNDIGNIRLYKR